MRNFAFYKNFIQGLRRAQKRLLREFLKSISEPECKPFDRARAAAHEAGRVILATALGDRVLEAKITFDEGPHWVGESLFQTTINNPDPFCEDLLMGFVQLCQSLGGMAGQIQSQNSRLSLSFDEREQTTILLSKLPKSLSVSEEWLFLVSATLVHKALNSNIKSFESVRKYLYNNSRLNSSEAARMLKSVEVIDLGYLSGRGRYDSVVLKRSIVDYIESDSVCH